jgi:hypothetical protein
MSKGGGTQTTKEERSYAPWIGDMQQAVGGLGLGLNQNFLGNAPQYGIAGFNPDQTKAFDLTRGTALQYGVDNTSDLLKNLQNGSTVTPASSQAATIDTNRIGQLMNPYLQTVGKNAIDSMRDEYQNADASLAAKYADSSAFGGSGEALARGQVARGYQKDVGDMMAQLMAQGYDQASAQALAEAQMQQQTNLSNAQMQQEASLSNANNAINVANTSSNIMTADQARQLAAISALLGVGQTQQGLTQQSLDMPWTALQRLASIVPSVYDYECSSTQPTQDGGLGGVGSLLGGVASIARLFPLSDRREKTDIQKLGKDEASGLDMYAYRYRGDPKSYPKVVGPMAQDIMKKFPDAVTEVGGRLAINPTSLETIFGA